LVKENLRRIIIAAVSENGIIGNKNRIPWHSKAELSHFKNTTIGSAIIMGRKTFDSIGKLLPGRINIVITKNTPQKSKESNLLYLSSVGDAYKYLRYNKYTKVFICGGSTIYKNVIKHADEMIISHMKFKIMGDKKYPKINMKLWKVYKTENHKEFNVKYYTRIN